MPSPDVRPSLRSGLLALGVAVLGLPADIHAQVAPAYTPANQATLDGNNLIVRGYTENALLSIPNCQYILGFKTLHDLIPDTVGDCLDNQAFAANGDAQQHTTDGLLAWRKSDNWTAFTNGYMTWVNGPNGIQSRLNTDRFPFEHDQTAISPQPTKTEAPQAPLTIDSVVNNPNIKFNNWSNAQIPTLRGFWREAIIRSQKVFPNGYGAYGIDGNLASALATLGVSKEELVKDLNSAGLPLQAAAGLQSVSTSTHPGFLAWAYPSGDIELDPSVTTNQFVDQHTAPRSHAMAIIMFAKEAVFAQALYKQTNNDGIVDRLGYYLCSILVKQGALNDIYAPYEVDYYSMTLLKYSINPPA